MIIAGLDKTSAETGCTAGTSLSAISYRRSTKYADTESGLMYYGYRSYQPNIGRWFSKDPLAEEGGAHLYAFLFNAPEEWIDPWGLKIHVDGDKDVVKAVLDALAQFIRGQLSTDDKGYLQRKPNPKDCQTCPKDEKIERWIDEILAASDEYDIVVTDAPGGYGAGGTFAGNAFGKGGKIRVKPNPEDWYEAEGGTWQSLWHNYEYHTFSSVLAHELIGRAYAHCKRTEGMDKAYGELDRKTKDALNQKAVERVNEVLDRLGKKRRTRY